MLEYIAGPRPTGPSAHVTGSRPVLSCPHALPYLTLCTGAGPGKCSRSLAGTFPPHLTSGTSTHSTSASSPPALPLFLPLALPTSPSPGTSDRFKFLGFSGHPAFSTFLYSPCTPAPIIFLLPRMYPSPTRVSRRISLSTLPWLSFFLRMQALKLHSHGYNSNQLGSLPSTNLRRHL